VTAPVQLLTIGVDQPLVPESVVDEFARLEERGLVRVLDVLFVRHSHDGDVDSIERADADRMRFDGSLLAALLNADDDASASDTVSAAAPWSVHDAVPAGGVAAIVMVEHLWAEPLVTSMLASGGQLFDEFWLSAGDRALLDRLISSPDRHNAPS
jgi:hypothetical protein